MGLVPGLAALNAVFAAFGFCLLAPALRGSTLRSWLSYAGLALLLGAGVPPALLGIAVVGGLRPTSAAFLIVAVLLAAGGIAAAIAVPPRWRSWIAPHPSPRRAPATAAATALFTALVGICVLALVGGFRAPAWLDDTWNFWVPKGEALASVGLDERLFAPSDEHLYIPNTYYPLWYPILVHLELDFVGRLDFRALSGQDTIFVVAFAGSVARLLWGHVRPWLLWAALLLLVASPGVFRQAQGGGADLPLAVFLGLSFLCFAGWLAHRNGFALFLLVPMLVTTFAIKREAFPQVMIVFAVVAVLGWSRARPQLLPVAGAAFAAWLTTVPWALWRRAHDVPNEFVLSNALSPGYLRSHFHQAESAINSFWYWSIRPQEWLIIFPAVVALAAFGFVRERRLVWLIPISILCAIYAFWIWIFWGYPDDLAAQQPTPYRLLLPLALLASLLIAVMAERLLGEDLEDALGAGYQHDAVQADDRV